MIISRIAPMRSASKNMCSVRRQADPLGAEAARGAGIGRRSRHWRAPSILRIPSAQPISVAKSPDSSRLDRRHLAEHDLAGRAVDRDQVAGPHQMVAHRQRAGLRSRCADRRRRRRRAGPCRARRPRRGSSCRRASSGCPWRHACRGCPRGWSRSAPGSPPRRGAPRASASSAENTTLPEAAPGEAGSPRASTVVLARRDRASGAAAGRANPARCAGSPRCCSMTPFLDQRHRDLQRRLARCACRCGSAASRACRARP